MDGAPNGVLACPVRGCCAPLQADERALRCPRGHSFDRARSGYVNLLQPQDKKSVQPGDSREAVAARRRTIARGMGGALQEAIASMVAGWSIPPGRSVLDVGSGEGTILAAVASRFGLRAWGLDLSPAAAQAAARAYPHLCWIVANADRRLPILDQRFDLLLSVTSRKNAPEFHRVLAAMGRLLVVVPAEDDLRELREAVLGAALHKDRASAACELLAPFFELERDERVRSSHVLEPAALEDLLRGSYRGERHAQRSKSAALQPMQVTLSYRVLGFRPRVVAR